MTMTLECETEFPRALKDNMKNLGFEGAAVYKGFPFMDKGQEYWWVELHMYKNKDEKEMPHPIRTNERAKGATRNVRPARGKQRKAGWRESSVRLHHVEHADETRTVLPRRARFF